MSDRDSLAGFSEAAAPDDASTDMAAFSAGPRRGAPAPRGAPARHAFRARPKNGATGAAAPLQAAPQLEFNIRPPPEDQTEREPRARPDSTDLQLESPPSSNRSADFDTALLRERIEARHALGSASPTNSASDNSSGSAAITGLTRWIGPPSDSSIASRTRARQHRSRFSLPAPGQAKRPRLAGLPEDGDEDAQSAVSGIFGRDPLQPEPPAAAPRALLAEDSFGNNDVGGVASDMDEEAAAPSVIHSGRADSDAYNGDRGTSDDTASAQDASAQDAEGAPGTAPRAPSPDTSEYVRPRPRDPAEPEPPLVFEVPVSMMPAIDWLAVALDAEGQVLEQRLEHSESESDSDESLGSVAEMVASNSDTEAESDGNAEWEPKAGPAVGDAAASSSSEQASDSDADSFTAATVSESGDSDFTPDVESQVAQLGSRRERPKRHRIPTVKWWLGERIQYEVDGPLSTLTAVDVRRVEPEKKVYRRRRPYRRRRGPLLPLDEDELEAGQQAVHAPVLDADGTKFRERTVARSINGLEFEPMYYADGSVMPLVSRCAIFGGSAAGPVQLYVLRIQPGAVYTYEADVNKVCTFVVWRGRCTAKMNRTDFDLQKGMACIVPPANDLYVDNGSNTEQGARGLGEDVFFFATEINARDSPDLAAAMTRDAQSVVSGAATLSRLFQMDRDDDLGQGAQSFVSGLQQFSAQADNILPSDSALEPQQPDDPGGLFDDDQGFDDGSPAPGLDAPDSDDAPGDADDALSVVPSIFQDMQEDRYERRQPPRQNAQLLSFQIGRTERALPSATPAAGTPREDEAPPSFHLERGSRLPASHRRRAAPEEDPHHARAQAAFQTRTAHRQLRSTSPPRHGLTSSQAHGFDDDELNSFFAQVNDGLEGPNSGFMAESRHLPSIQPGQYMLERLARIARPPNDTDTQSSGS